VTCTISSFLFRIISRFARIDSCVSSIYRTAVSKCKKGIKKIDEFLQHIIPAKYSTILKTKQNFAGRKF